MDDKFTVICYGAGAAEGGQTLPGLALDADPRFPFYGISHEIEKVAKGEGNRIESYLQLRTTNQSKIKNKIIIDSPGFDADDQRRATLRITDRIIDLSDLVLIFFDAAWTWRVSSVRPARLIALRRLAKHLGLTLMGHGDIAFGLS